MNRSVDLTTNFIVAIFVPNMNQLYSTMLTIAFLIHFL